MLFFTRNISVDNLHLCATYNRTTTRKTKFFPQIRSEKKTYQLELNNYANNKLAFLHVWINQQSQPTSQA